MKNKRIKNNKKSDWILFLIDLLIILLFAQILTKIPVEKYLTEFILSLIAFTYYTRKMYFDLKQ